jgi:hypothetical protein
VKKAAYLQIGTNVNSKGDTGYMTLKARCDKISMYVLIE